VKRSPFKRKPFVSLARVRQWEGPTPTPRAPAVQAVARVQAVAPLVKSMPLQHAGYMDLVRSMACYRCRHRPRSQFCHRDEGKGGGLKTDCREGWPGCGPHDGMPGCHWYVGTSGNLPKAQRRAFELEAGAATRAAVIASGQWPKRLPLWEESPA
jgi:hypothetical protein